MLSPSIASESASSLPESGLLPIADWYARMEEAERGEGWIAWCRDHDCYVAWSEELVTSLTHVLNRFPGTVLEVGAGRGELAAALRSRMLNVVATDCSPGDTHVIALGAGEALKENRPVTVVSSFLPVDAGIEAEVMRCTSVRRYLYIGPIVMGRTGPQTLWDTSGWSAEELPEVDRVLISRLDLLVDFTRRKHRRGAAAVLFERVE